MSNQKYCLRCKTIVGENVTVCPHCGEKRFEEVVKLWKLFDEPLEMTLSRYESTKRGLEEYERRRDPTICVDENTRSIFSSLEESIQQYCQSFVDTFIRVYALQGEARHQFLLGWAYDIGMGVPRSRELALMWYRRAAAQGYEMAKNRLLDQGEEL